jgi:hypothetical protein
MALESVENSTLIEILGCYMLNLFYQFADNPLPEDVWNEIAQYIDPQDVEALRLACRYFNTQLAQDAIWQPLLNRLHAIDTRIPTRPQNGQTCREIFIEGFYKIRKRQGIELEYIHRRLDFFFIKDILNDEGTTTQKNKNAFIKDILIPKIVNLQAIKLIELESNHAFLERLNIETLEYNQFFAEKFLNGAFTVELTRLSKEAFKGFPLEPFWKDLKFFMVEGIVEDLPSEIIICENLEKLVLRSNFISKLPDEVGQLKTLVELDLRNNQLRLLPESMCLLTSLGRLDLRGNNLEKLPVSIDKLCNLKSLLLDKNLRYLVPAAFFSIELERDVDTAIQEDSHDDIEIVVSMHVNNDQMDIDESFDSDDDQVPLSSSPKRRKTF